MILILQKKLIEKIDHYILRNYSRIFLDYRHMIMTDLLWPLDYMTLISPALLYIYLASLAQLCIFHLILSLSTLSRDIDTHCFHYLTSLFLILFPDHLHWVTHYFVLALINKINQAGVTGGDCSRENPERCAWKGGSSEGLTTRVLVFLRFMCTLVITCYMIPEYSELFFPAIRIH